MKKSQDEARGDALPQRRGVTQIALKLTANKLCIILIHWRIHAVNLWAYLDFWMRWRKKCGSRSWRPTAGESMSHFPAHSKSALAPDKFSCRWHTIVRKHFDSSELSTIFFISGFFFNRLLLCPWSVMSEHDLSFSFAWDFSVFALLISRFMNW